MTAILLPNGKQQYFTTAGLPAVGYKVATFDAGTSNPRITWQDALKVAQQTNPIILDGRGEASIFWEGAYKVQLQDSTGAPIWTQDNLQSQQNGFVSSLVPAVTNSIDLGSVTLSWRNLYLGPNNAPVLDTASGDIGYYARTAAETAAGVTPASFVYTPDHIGYDVRRSGAVLNGTIDDSGAIGTAASVGANIYIPRGTARFAANKTFTVPITADYLAIIKPDAAISVTVGKVLAGNWQVFDVSNSGAAVIGFVGQVINAAWFGCVGDGNFTTGTGTDNLLPLQRAINAAATGGGGAVHLPAGIYKVSAQVTVPSGVSIFGTGMWGTIIFAPTAFANLTGLIAINGAAGFPTVWDGISVVGQQGGCSGSGIVSTKNGTIIKNVWISAFAASGSFGVILNQTDNYLQDSILELNWGGVELLQNNITLTNIKTYQHQLMGVYVNNTGATGQGRCLIEGHRSSDDAQNAILINTGANSITITGSDASSTVNAKYSAGAINGTSATDIKIIGYSATLTAGASTAPGISLTTCTGVDVTGGTVTGFFDGIQANSCTGLTVTGGRFNSNSRRGVYLSSGTQITVSGVSAVSNANAGIYSDNSAAGSFHNLNGNSAYNNTTFGFVVNIGSGTAFTNLQSNMARGNTSGQYSLTGTTANINGTITPTANATNF